MKQAVKVLSLGLVAMILMSVTVIPPPDALENKVIGTYSGIDESGYFMFELDNEKSMLFHEQDEELEITLYDDANEGKRFKITWEKVDIDLYDDEGESTGETFEGRRITHLEEM